MASWIKRNALNLVLAVLVCVGLFFFFRDKTLEQAGSTIWTVILVAAGLSFVIFIHELGHFLAAKWCNVYVETFSVGFGPPIPGCWFRRGETLYKLAVFPLGGYVKMRGENPEEAENPDGTPTPDDDPRSFKNKTVSQRMLIISAGVIMNVLLGMACFVYVYLEGKPELAPLVGVVDPGSPADRAGVRAGSTLLQVDDSTKPSFMDVIFQSMAARPGSTEIYMKWRDPDGKEHEGNLIPRKLDTDLKPMVGMGIPEGLQLFRGEKDGKNPNHPGTPAAAAPFKPGDILIGVRVHGQKDFRPLRSWLDLVRAEDEFKALPLDFEVVRGGKLVWDREQGKDAIQGGEKTIVANVPPQYTYTLGLAMEMGPVVGVSPDAPPFMKEVLPGDRITGLTIDGKEAVLDPARLADDLMAAARAGRQVAIQFRRGDRELTVAIDPKALAGRGTWIEQRPISASSPFSVPALGLTYAAGPRIASVEHGSAADLAKLRPGDELVQMTWKSDTEGTRKYDLAEYHWPTLFNHLQNTSIKTVSLVIKRNGAEERVTLTARPDPTWPWPYRGFYLERPMQTVHADGIGEAIALGFRDTHRWIMRIYLNLRGLITRDLSAKNLSGPLGILQATYAVAEHSFVELVFFLGMISINLAVVNFLPIPILDGGHMVFLIIEKIRGKPASERALAIGNTVGLVILGSLMLFVIVMDISRLPWVRKFF